MQGEFILKEMMQAAAIVFVCQKVPLKINGGSLVGFLLSVQSHGFP